MIATHVLQNVEKGQNKEKQLDRVSSHKGMSSYRCNYVADIPFIPHLWFGDSLPSMYIVTLQKKSTFPFITRIVNFDMVLSRGSLSNKHCT